MRVSWLPAVLMDAGLEVYVMPGFATRGGEMRTVHGVVGHHTATGTNWQDGHVAYLLRDGRRDLAGPLAQLGLERDGTWVCIASGRANHNGYGTWGNDSIGIEAYNDGRGEPWPADQVNAWQIGTAAILDRLGYGADRFRGHRETDPDRKPDPVGIDLDAFRAAVDRHLEDPLAALSHDEQRRLLDNTDRIAAFIDEGGGLDHALAVQRGHLRKQIRDPLAALIRRIAGRAGVSDTR